MGKIKSKKGANIKDVHKDLKKKNLLLRTLLYNGKFKSKTKKIVYKNAFSDENIDHFLYFS